MTLLLRLLGGGCAALVCAASAHAACKLEQVTQMPLLSLGAHYAVMVGIEDVARPMVVDTGAEATLLKASVVNELSIKRDPVAEHARPMLGVGQTHADALLNAIPSQLAFGDLVYRNRSTAVATMEDGKTPEGDSVGLLGDDILSQFDVEFDFPSHKLSFYREIGCFSTFLPWAGPFAAIPFDHRGAKVTIDILLNRERTRAMVDTGNNLSFVSHSAPALWGSYESDIAPTKTRAQSPLNHAGPLAVASYPFAKVTIGGDVFVDKSLSVIDVDLPLAKANLGLDYWSSRKIWISYPREWMFVADDPAAAKLAHPVALAPPPPPADAETKAAN
jgi:hypothetical protein